MSRTLGVCWIFLWITAAANATYVLSNETASWQDAKNTGKFATPNIQINTNNLLIIVNTTSDLNKNQTAWVGYYKKETAFAYIGCGRLNNVELEVLLPELKNSPGLCYSMCNKSNENYIGLNKDMCVCMSAKPSGNLSLSGCSHKYGYWVAGGGNGSLSIYKKIKKDINVKSNSQYNIELCLAFQNRDHWWKNCTFSYRPICKKDGNTFLVSHSGRMYFEWWEYVQLCFENGSHPVTYADTTTLNITDASSESWTDVIRSKVIYKYTETSFEISRENVVSYGYISIRGNVTELSFTRTKFEKKRYLLQTHKVTLPNGLTSLSTGNVPNTTSSFSTGNVPNTTTSFTTGNVPNTTTSFSTGNVPNTTSSISTGNVPNTTISFKDPNSVSTSTSSVNDGLLNSSETFQSNSQESKSESSDVSVPVSISVVAVIIVAVIITIITLKRRGKLQGICTKSSALDNLSKRTSDLIPADNKLKKYNESAVDDYEQISELKDIKNEDVNPDLDVENGNYGHTYFILEPVSRESHTDGGMSDSKNDESEINDDYNTLHLNKTFGAKADDTYDTTEKAALKLKALRNTGCEKEFPEKLNGNEEDTYNHINRNLLKNNKTDNIYGVTDNQENDYGDVNNGCKKNRHNGDDTYSHLNTTH